MELDVSRVRDLLEVGADAMATTSHGDNPLHLLALYGAQDGIHPSGPSGIEDLS